MRPVMVPGFVLAIAALCMAQNATTNPADTYRQAAKLVATLRLDREESAKFDRYLQAGPDESANAFFTQHIEITKLLRSAVPMAGCDWGNLGAQDRIDEQNRLNGLARFIHVQTQLDIQNKNPSASVEDSIAELTLARNVGQKPILTTKLLEIAMELRATELLASALPGLPGQQLDELTNRLDRLPNDATGQELMTNELANGKAMLQEQGQGNNIAIMGMMQSMSEFYARAGQAMDEKSPSEFDAIVDGYIDQYKLNPFIKIVGPSLKSANLNIAVARAERAMLRTAIDILKNGEVAVAKSKDPYGEGPFAYAKTDNGFTLTSQLKRKDQPIKLKAGK